jgi:signal transduction histidine kinase
MRGAVAVPPVVAGVDAAHCHREADSEPGEAGRLLERSREELDEALKELRELARRIHPAVLSDRGLGAAVETLANRAPLPVEVGALPGERLPEQVELAAYFVVSETLTNVAKHASGQCPSLRREVVWAYVFVDTENPGPKRVVREIRKLDGVVRADAMLGTPDVIAIVEGGGLAEMGSVDAPSDQGRS